MTKVVFLRVFLRCLKVTFFPQVNESIFLANYFGVSVDNLKLPHLNIVSGGCLYVR